MLNEENLPMIGILTQLDVAQQAASWKPQMAQKGRWRMEETLASDGVFLMSVNKMCLFFKLRESDTHNCQFSVMLFWAFYQWS